MGADVAAFAADSCSLLESDGPSRIRRQIQVTVQFFLGRNGPRTYSRSTSAGRLHTARYGAEACGAGCSGSSSK